MYNLFDKSARYLNGFNEDKNTTVIGIVACFDG